MPLTMQSVPITLILVNYFIYFYIVTEKEIVKDELTQMIGRIANNLDSTGTSASGRTAKSMFVEDTEFGVIVWTSRRYFKGVEIGRPAGGVPKGFNQIIKQWILDKGITVTQLPYKRKPSANWQPKYSVPERSLIMAAGAIASNIKSKGTGLHQSGGRSDIYSQEIETTVGNIKKRLASEVIAQIKSNIRK